MEQRESWKTFYFSDFLSRIQRKQQLEEKEKEEALFFLRPPEHRRSISFPRKEDSLSLSHEKHVRTEAS